MREITKYRSNGGTEFEFKEWALLRDVVEDIRFSDSDPFDDYVNCEELETWCKSNFESLKLLVERLEEIKRES